MIEPSELKDIYDLLPKSSEPKLGPIFMTKDGRFSNLGEEGEHSSIFGEGEYDSDDYHSLEDNFGLIKANGGNRLEPIPYIDLWKAPNEAQRRAISKWVELLMASGKRSMQVNSGIKSEVVAFGDNSPEDICKDIVRAAIRPIGESLEDGQRVSISNTGTFWDGKEGTIESFEGDSCTILVDWGDKVVRQDFNLSEIDKKDDIKESKLLMEDESMEDRKEALAKYLGCDASEIGDGYRENVFEHDGEEWAVLNGAEAEEWAEDDVRQIYDDMGLEAFTDSFRDYIMYNLLDEDAVRDMMYNYFSQDVNDLDDSDCDVFGSGLVAELYDADLLTDDDLTEDEDGETILKDNVDLDSLKDELIEKKVNDNDPVDWLHEFYSDREIGEFIEDNGLVDLDEVVGECIAQDGVAHFIASYDGDEVDLGPNLCGYRLR